MTRRSDDSEKGVLQVEIVAELGWGESLLVVGGTFSQQGMERWL